MASLSQSIYSPLPQSISDSESEKELHMDPLIYKNKQKKNNAHIRIQQKNQYQKMGNDIPAAKHITPKMSPLRKCAFIFSVILCFFPFVLFLWILPCSDINSCVVPVSSWKSKQDNIELKGPINVIRGSYNENINLALLYVGGFNQDSTNNGAISFSGKNGAVKWNFRQEIPPKKLDCSLIDTSNSGTRDCLILDDMGLKAIKSSSGEIIWYAHSREEAVGLEDLGFPVVFPDINNDKVDELLTIYKKQNLLLICGKTGKALKSFKLICKEATGLKHYKSYITYCCNKDTDCYWADIKDLRSNFKNDSYEISFIKFEDNPQRNKQTFSLAGKILIGENQGVFPNSTAYILLIEEISNKTIMSLNYKNTYVMKIEQFSFPFTISNMFYKKYVKGFIIKMWQWHNTDSQTHFMLNENHVNHSFTANFLTEQVVLLTFNDTNAFSPVNASVMEITQLCYSTTSNYACQPDIHNQEDSLLITDIDNDDTQELISHSSTYVMSDEKGSKNKKWVLYSHIKVVHLQEELLKSESFD